LSKTSLLDYADDLELEISELDEKFPGSIFELGLLE